MFFLIVFSAQLLQLNEYFEPSELKIGPAVRSKYSFIAVNEEITLIIYHLFQFIELEMF